VTRRADGIVGLEVVLGDPYGAARHLLEADIYGLVDVQVRLADRGCVIFWLTLAPWAPMAKRGYPTERVGICVWRNGRIVAVPHNAKDRLWYHRNVTLFGELCLWFPGDPRSLRWDWVDGLVRYVTIVHRHLQAEEFWRRHDRWPSEDAPHGAGDHPIRTWEMRRIAEQGARS
jgi:hypothetical protein